MDVTPHVVPHGWTKGGPLRQHGGGRVGNNERYPGWGPFPPGHNIALCQDLGFPPRLVPVTPETVYAIEFRDADDVNQWLDWWYGAK